MIFAAILPISGMALTGQALLDDMSLRATQFFYQQSHPSTGFTKDRAKNSSAGDSYTIASVASTGFALTALAIGADKGWINKTTALNRAKLTLNSLLTKTPREHGWFYHFINWQTGAREWQCEVSSIDTSILLAGATVAEKYFQDAALTTSYNQILNGIDWQWMLTNGGALPNSKTFCMGWRPENGWIINRWENYDELKMLVIQGIGKSGIMDESNWAAFARPIINFQNIQLITGGPLFMHQMSESFMSFENLRDKLGFDYWVASRNATRANRQYCILNPNTFTGYGPNFWGLTASDGPDGYRGYGAPGWGTDDGTVAPTCVASSIDFMPTECQATLDNFSTNYTYTYGKYGFCNAFNPTRSWTDPDVIGIDLGMAMCAIENRRNHFVHKLSAKSAMVKDGMWKAGLRRASISSRNSEILKR